MDTIAKKAEIKEEIEFGQASDPKKYEAQINNIQKEILKSKGPFIPDKMQADEVIPVSENQEPIGFGFLFYKNNIANEARIISPEFQGKGIGMKLLGRLENQAKTNGAKEIHSFISDKNPNATIAMEKAGYRKVRTEPGRILYSKRLNPQLPHSN